jgi:hypothetical protein
VVFVRTLARFARSRAFCGLHSDPRSPSSLARPRFTRTLARFARELFPHSFFARSLARLSSLHTVSLLLAFSPLRRELLAATRAYPPSWVSGCVVSVSGIYRPRRQTHTKVLYVCSVRRRWDYMRSTGKYVRTCDPRLGPDGRRPDWLFKKDDR